MTVLLYGMVVPTGRRVLYGIVGWWHGIVVSGVRRMNEVNARRARLVLGWVYHLGMQPTN